MNAPADTFTAADVGRVAWPTSWRVEVVDGELVVTHAPGWIHQLVVGNISLALMRWADVRDGRVNSGIGLVYDDERDDVIPDVVWISTERLASLDEAGHLRNNCPELVVEVVSPGRANERRDRESKRDVYQRRGALEYWIVDPQLRTVDQLTRSRADEAFSQATLREDDWLGSGLLPGFAIRVSDFWR